MATAEAKLEKKLNPGRLIKARPWLTRRALSKAPERRYRATLRNQKFLMAQVLLVPVQIASGRLFVIPFILMGVVGGWRTSRDLKRHPDHFFERDARTRELLARYDAAIAEGAWTIGPSPLTVLGLPLAVAGMMMMNKVLIGKGSFLGFAATGLLIGAILSLADVAWHVRARLSYAVPARLRTSPHRNDCTNVEALSPVGAHAMPKVTGLAVSTASEN